MAESGIPPLTNQVLDFIADCVRSTFQQRGRAVTGAVLADQIRNKFPNFEPPQQLGDHWLAGLIRLAERDGKVVRNRNAKHLEVFPPTDQTDLSTPSFAADDYTEKLYVRHDLWKAFVFVTQPGPRYFDRRDHRVVSSASVADQSDDALLRIEPIPAKEQQTWMREFVESRDSLSGQDAPIEEEYWWVKFTQWLREINPEIEFQWRKVLSAKVVERIRGWALENDVRLESILVPVRIQSQGNSPMSKRSSSRGMHDSDIKDTAIREAIINAVSEMPLEDLKNLPIPIRYILRHFRAQ